MVLSHHDDNDGWFDAKKVQCHSCAKRESSTKGSSKDPYVAAPGEKVYTVYTRPANKPLPM